MARPRLSDKQKADNAAKKKTVAPIKQEPTISKTETVQKDEPVKQETKANEVINQTLSDIVTPDLEEGAIYNEGHPGFKEDYLVLHCLLKAHKPRLFLEIGTHIGTGTNIICNALEGIGEVMSLDLPYEQADLSKQQPLSEGKGYTVGSECKRNYVQLWGNTLDYDFTQHPSIQGWFIDGEHTYQHVKVESRAAVASGAKLIVWHDADMPEVWEAITEVMLKSEYKLYRVTDTRIAYALK